MFSGNGSMKNLFAAFSMIHVTQIIEVNDIRNIYFWSNIVQVLFT